jgi:diguanylate cyclase (GGDEF)-like protein/PAS domain S-box-containing protein
VRQDGRPGIGGPFPVQARASEEERCDQTSEAQTLVPRLQIPAPSDVVSLGVYFDVEMYKRLLDGLFEGVYFVDTQRRIVYWNEAAERITGYHGDKVVGRGCSDNILCHVDEAGHHLCKNGCPLAATLTNRSPGVLHVYLQHAQGHRVPVRVAAAPIMDAEGQVIGAVESFVEDSEWRAAKDRVAELEKYAFVDALTEMPNRRYLERTLDIKIGEANRYGWACGVLLIDIDHFKRINDQFGHDQGDAVLRMVAGTLQAGVRSLDLAGRWGGEEFMVIVGNASQNAVLGVAERLRALVATSRLNGSNLISVTISVGAAVIRNGESATDLIRRADESLYQAKREGRNTVRVNGQENPHLHLPVVQSP